MWFLWFWLISVGVCAIVVLLYGTAATKRYKREFPNEPIKKKKSFAELLCSFMPFVIPFLNLLLLLGVILQGEKVINESIAKSREEQNQIKDDK